MSHPARGPHRARELTISTRNARWQQWHALLGNRTKRTRAGEFLVQGVRPITMAVDAGWPVRAVLRNADRTPSRWAADLLDRAGGERVAMSGGLLAELADKDDDAPELLAVVAIPPDDLGRVQLGPADLAVVFDRPTSPGNIGALIRSVDAFGGRAVLVAGHAADPYDPKAVRASTGSLFTVPVVRVPGAAEVLAWVAQARTRQNLPLRVVGTDESAPLDVADADLTGPTLLVVGNETTGMSSTWRHACDDLVRIPITGGASSLNATTAAAVVLYEADRQRRHRGH